jgi:hypothetical protein
MFSHYAKSQVVNLTKAAFEALSRMTHATRLTGEIPIEPVEIAENRRVHALTRIFIPQAQNSELHRSRNAARQGPNRIAF